MHEIALGALLKNVLIQRQTVIADVLLLFLQRDDHIGFTCHQLFVFVLVVFAYDSSILFISPVNYEIVHLNLFRFY